ncbi:MAG: hypothetical protein OEN02_17680 [Gammaproteobacteria bacterium]|nr:hypothetical protein [Gammaproteobacteria bacterium]MDH3537321.1 hypothetical protein [Gammaproteobacteria bacterium]
MRKFSFIFLLVAAMNCHADSDLFVPFLSGQVGNSTDLGAVEVEGVGAVNLIATKSGNQLMVHARDPKGKVIGKADSVVGLNDTPIYVSTSTGLSKITIYWGKE